MSDIRRPFFTWVPIGLLRPHEAVREKKAASFHGFAARVKRMYTKPILIDAETKVILDGHHRYFVCRQLGCELVPCVAVDYVHDPHITVFPRRQDIAVTKESIIAMGLSGNTYPPKTTKHVFQIPEMERRVQLTRHRKTEQRNVDQNGLAQEGGGVVE